MTLKLVLGVDHEMILLLLGEKYLMNQYYSE